MAIKTELDVARDRLRLTRSGLATHGPGPLQQVVQLGGGIQH